MSEIRTQARDAPIDPFTDGYLRAAGEPHETRLARGIYARWASTPVVIEGTDVIVGRITERSIAGFHFGSGVTCDATYADELIEKHPERTGEIRRVLSFWKNKTVDSRVVLGEDEKYLGGNNLYWAGWGGHAVLDFTGILDGGTLGLRKRIGTAAAANREQAGFCDALTVMCDAIDIFAENYARHAYARSRTEPDFERKAELLRISKICSKVPRRGASTFREALQAFWFIHLLDGCDSPGRFDQYMYPYLRRDLDAGVTTRDGAQSLLDHLWSRFNDVRSWNLCVGGLKPDGTDGTNDLTYMCLEATRRCRQVAPNLSLRLHAKSPDELWSKALEVIETGVGMRPFTTTM